MKTNLTTELVKNKLSWLKTSLAKVAAGAMMLMLGSTGALAQTLPTTFDLAGGSYSFTTWASSSSSGTYPANMYFHTVTAEPTSLSTSDGAADWTCAYNLSSRSRILGKDASGVSFIGTSSAQFNNCSSGTATKFPAYAVVGLKTTGRSSVQVSWTGGTVTVGDGNGTPSNPRVWKLRLQYRVGGSGSWTDVSGPVEYTSSTSVGSSSFGPTTLPAGCENQSAVYLRWAYFQSAAGNGGTRPEIRLDEITVSSSSASSTVAPTVTTQGASATNNVRATLNGTITADGGAAVTSYGFYYATTANATTNSANKMEVSTTTPGSYPATFLTNMASVTLNANAQYFYVAYATNSAGTNYGSPTNFWTYANTPLAPTLGSATQTSIPLNVAANDTNGVNNPSYTMFAIAVTNTTSTNYVQANGTLGGSPVYQTGMTWNPNSAALSVNTLSGATAYKFVLIATNGSGVPTAFGAVATATTLASAPSVTTQGASATNVNSGTLNGTIISDGGAPVTSYGFYYGTQNPVTIANSTQRELGTTPPNGGVYPASFSYPAPFLPANAICYVAAYASNSVGNTLDSVQTNFWTYAVTPLSPTLGAATQIGIPLNIDSADTNGVDNPYYTMLAIAVTNSANSTTNYVQANGTLGATPVYQTGLTWNPAGAAKAVTGLTGATTYGFFVLATNGMGVRTAFSTAAVATTLPSAPSVSTQGANPTNTTSATLNGTITATGGGNVTDYGFYYGTATPVTTSSTLAQVGTGPISSSTSFNKPLTGLSPNVKYFYRSYATNTGGATLDTAETNFWTYANTPQVPFVGGISHNPTNATFRLAGQDTNGMNNPSYTMFAIVVTNSANSTTNYVQADGTLGVSPVYQTGMTWNPNGADKTVTGLTGNTKYGFFVVATNGAGVRTAFSGENDITTQQYPPTLTTSGASATNSARATLNGTITDNGGVSITEYGFYYSTTLVGVTNGTKLQVSTTTVSTYPFNFSTNMANTTLAPNTLYYYASYATNTAGTNYGSPTNFWTYAATPAAPTVSSATTNTLTVMIGADSNPSYTVYAIQETSSGNYVQANGTLGASPVYQTSNNWSTGTSAGVVTNLSKGSTYTFQVVATNGMGIAATGPTASGTTLNAAFGAGDIVVERMEGTGTGGTPVSLVEYNTSGTLQQTLSLPNASTRPTGNPYNLMDSGNATSNGGMTRSADGTQLVLSGYNGISTDASIAGSSTATVLRTIGLVNNAASVDTSRAINMLSGNNYRSVTSSNNTEFWAAGQPGIVYVKPSVATNTLSAVNTRVVKIFNGQLYYSTGSGTIGIYSLGTGLPTSGSPTATALFATGAGTSPYGFEINPTGNVCYVADDRTTSGIQKWTNNGTWTLLYTLGTGASFGARGLAVDWSGASPVIYATTAETSANRLITITDTGTGTDTATTLATASASQIFRGVAFAPKPTYTLTYTAGANGSISGTRPQTVVSGNSGSAVTAVPATGYHFVNWSDSSTANPRTDSSVSGNISVTANFAINTYTLTYNTSTGGTISGTTLQTVNYGGNGSTVTAVPDTGNHFTGWNDGVATASRTDTGIVNNTNVTANFATNTYNLVATSGAHGTVTPAGTTVVNYNGSQAYSIAAASGYNISDVLVDGSSVGPVSTYTFSTVTAAHTISASFVLACTTPDATVTPATNSVCAGSTGNTASAPTGADTYAWSISGGTITAGGSTRIVTYTAGGAGTLTLTCAATNGGSCYDVKNANVTVNALPSTSGVSGTTPVIHASTHTYSVTATAGSTYGWTVPTDATYTGGTGNSIDVTFGTTSGNVSVIETNNSGCTGSQQTLAVTVSANNAPTANVMNVLRTPDQAVLIALSDIATNWNDLDGDTVRMTAYDTTTTNGVYLTPLSLTTDSSGYLTSGLLGYTNTVPTPNLNDQFTYTISDGYGGTASGTVNIVVSPFVAGTQTISGQQTTNSINGSTFTVTYYGIPGYTYLLQRSTNLFTGALWVDIATNTIGNGGVTNVIDNFSDIPGGHPNSAYYRVGWKTSY